MAREKELSIWLFITNKLLQCGNLAKAAAIFDLPNSYFIFTKINMEKCHIC